MSVRSWLHRPVTWIVVGSLVVVVAVVGLVLFQPWKLWVDQSVDEAAPIAVAPASPPAPVPSATPTAAAPSPSPPGPLATGAFISHEHRTTGSVQVVDTGDGRRVLRLENLDTSNGPDLRVWMTDAPVIEGRAGWTVFDDGAYTELGRLKGNKGSQNYPIPADLDLSKYTSVSIWCDRFNVSFGAAELKLVG